MCIRDRIRSLKKDHTVILSSHILSEVSAVCDQILIISKGELVASDTPDGLQAKLKGAGELELCVKGTAAQLKTLLSNLDGVESFTTTEAEDGTVLAQVSEKADCDIREPLFYELAENRMPLLLSLIHISVVEIGIDFCAVKCFSSTDYHTVVRRCDITAHRAQPGSHRGNTVRFLDL